jgi:hypothetical protein
MLFMGFLFLVEVEHPNVPNDVDRVPNGFFHKIVYCTFIISVVKQMVSALEIASLDGCKGLQFLINIPSTHQGVATYFTRYFTRSQMPIINQKSHK